MGFLDLIKKGVVEEFTGKISTGDLVLSLVTAIVASLIITYVYKKNYTGVSFTKQFALSIILLTMVTSLVIRTINSNLALSLGMVGALSIVRFRTAVKDPVDTIFMFWGITAGIMSGAGLYLVTILSTLLIGLLYFISFTIQSKQDNKKLLVIVTDTAKSQEIINILKNKKCILKTETYKNNIAELSFECKNRSQVEDIINMRESQEIRSINIIDIQ